MVQLTTKQWQWEFIKQLSLMNITNNNINADKVRPTYLTYIKDILHIGTHNIKGFNSIGKQIQFFTQYDIDYKLDIIGLTETKTKKAEEKIWSKTQKKYQKSKNTKKENDNRDIGISREFNNIYTTWWSGKEENYYGAGVGLAIKKSIAQRVYAIKKIDGRAIMADLHFQNKINVRIIIIYMPANQEDKKERDKINKIISEWITKGQYDKNN
jgi:exonuclease III